MANRWVNQLVARLRAPLWANVVTLSVLVGMVAGLGAVGFGLLLDLSQDAFLTRGARYVVPGAGNEPRAPALSGPTRTWLLLLVPVAGGLLAGLLIYSLAPEAEGHGTDAVVDAFHRKRGRMRKRVPLIKAVASALTIGSGGSAGREGPIGQIGAGFGSALASWLRLTDRERRLLVLAGAGAGIGAIFRAPLGGALFVCEVLYRDSELESAALVPAFVASIVSYSVYCAVTGVWGTMFAVPPLQFQHPAELPFYAALGAICAPLAAFYVRFFYGVRNAFRRIRIPNHFKPAIGGLVVGLIGFFFPYVLGMGYGWAQQAIDGTFTLKLAAALLILKIAATSFTIGSGGSGGVFAPSMTIGAMLGFLLGSLLHQAMPGIITQPAVAAFTLVGMAAFFSGAAKVPVASLVMVSEMTEGYGLLVPLMLANAFAFLLTPRRESIYENQVNTRVDSPAHRGEYLVDALEHITVRQAMAERPAPIAFHRETPLAQILRQAVQTQQQVFPVLEAGGTVFGLISLGQIRMFLEEPHPAPHLVVAEDLCEAAPRGVKPEDNLAAALRQFRTTDLEELPVIQAADGRVLVGLLSRGDLANAYHDYMRRLSAD